MIFETDNWKADDVTRALPHALGCEKSLLSSMFQDPQECIGIALDAGITEAHFYLPSHAVIFGFLVKLFSCKSCWIADSWNALEAHRH
jgi:hypothetical protein